MAKTRVKYRVPASLWKRYKKRVPETFEIHISNSTTCDVSAILFGGFDGFDNDSYYPHGNLGVEPELRSYRAPSLLNRNPAPFIIGGHQGKGK
jgi:hypothetical protein